MSKTGRKGSIKPLEKDEEVGPTVTSRADVLSAVREMETRVEDEKTDASPPKESKTPEVKTEPAPQSEKPKWNRYDNIFEIIRDTPTRVMNENIEDAIKRSLHRGYLYGKAYIHREPGSFISNMRRGSVLMPVWKIMVPGLDKPSVGAIYYVYQRGKDGETHIFRGTFGYGGTGPHESAMIEYEMTRRHLQIEIRDVDALLGFMEEQVPAEVNV